MNNKKVLVTGDVIVDHHVYEGQRSSPDSNNPIGSQEQTGPGGAGLIFELLKNVSQTRAKENQAQFDVKFGLAKNIYSKLNQNLHGYAVWKPCKPFGEQKEKVWRMVKPMGYGHSRDRTFPYADFIGDDAVAKPEIVVIDDGGLGFRLSTQKKAWPKVLMNKDNKNLEWIVLKMSNPIGQGDLWRHLSTNFQNKLIVIVSVDDVRKEEVRITKDTSWERSALDLVDELCHNPNINRLLNCKHLIINFGSEGALHVAFANTKRKFQLIYDPANLETEWGTKIDGLGLGFMSCITAGIVASLVKAKKGLGIQDVEFGIKAGLSAMRKMHILGHGNVGSKKPGIPFTDIADTICNPSSGFFNIELPLMSKPGDSMSSSWSIMTAQLRDVKKNPLPLYGMGKMVALLGPKVLSNIPNARFGKLYTADRNEIEKLRSINKLITDYEKHDKGKKPLSVAVFGPPGSGKSFGIIQIAEGILGSDVPVLEFNLSQFGGPDDLIGAFHQVRDKVLKGKTPVVFWDEFDSKEYMWLQYLLAPMQDGKFQEGQLTHPIGKCIFIFAGGTSFDMKNFGPEKQDKDAWKDFKLKKGPDFTSRLSGYLNVLGPNVRQNYHKKQKKWIEDRSDACFPIRRALLMRSMLKLFKGEYLKIDRGVLSALIEIEKYKHGARSLEKILGQLKQSGDDTIRRSNIPAQEIMELHADYMSFIQVANRDLEFKGYADLLAPHIHEYYRELGKKEGWMRIELDIDFNDLPEDYKEDNRQAAARIPQVLELVGLYVVPDLQSDSVAEKQIMDIIDRNLELLAQAEHDGWVEQKMRNGWVYGEPRDDTKKLHPSLVLYKFLSDEDKKKDRNSVLSYPDIIKKAKYKIVTSLKTVKPE